jgi:hypothetical protein
MLDAPLGVGERALALGERSRRQHHIGQLGRLGQEQILNDQELQLRERSCDRRAGLGRVQAGDVHAAQLAIGRCGPHLARAQASGCNRRAAWAGVGPHAHIQCTATVASRQQPD